MSAASLAFGPSGALSYKTGDGRLIFIKPIAAIVRNAMAYYTLESKEEGGIIYYRLRYDFWDIPFVYYSIWGLIIGYHGLRTDATAKANGIVRYSDWWTGGYYFPNNPPPGFVPTTSMEKTALHVQVYTSNPPTSSSVWTLFVHDSSSIVMGSAGVNLGTLTGISPKGYYGKAFPNATWDCPLSQVIL